MSAAPDYSVVILTWNSRRHVEACLTSLREAAPGRAAQLIVIDNGSEDGTPDLVRSSAPEAELIRNAENRGVAPARNQGLERVRAPVAIILDVDTVVEPRSLGRLLDYLEAEPSVGLCGPRLVLPDGGVQPSCQLFPTLRDKLARQLPRRLGETFLREVELASFDHHGTRDVDYVVGACQVIRMSALRAIGGLDDRIFYGPEDVDLCLRLQLAGWRVAFVGEAAVHHECQRVTRWRLGRLAWRHLAGLLHFYRTHGYLWSRAGLYRRIAAARRLQGLGMGEGTWSSIGSAR